MGQTIPEDIGGKWCNWNAPDNVGNDGNEGKFGYWFVVWSKELVSWPRGGTLFSTRWCSFAFTAIKTNVYWKYVEIWFFWYIILKWLFAEIELI